jgi:putative transcriptional regulator
MYKPIEIDRTNLTIMGVPFPDLDTLNRTADAMGELWLEGFEPTLEQIALIHDCTAEGITLDWFKQIAKNGILR